MKGVHQKASAGRIIATAPGRSRKIARPVPGRTRDTDHRQRCSRAAPRRRRWRRKKRSCATSLFIQEVPGRRTARQIVSG
ncbi:hypothetical protein BJH44_004471 [Salmonella enterica subsp. enterica serovar Bredeney]|nr:hypothetical protein [Salmonella enterica subsp. enterica serovar Bredeney]